MIDPADQPPATTGDTPSPVARALAASDLAKLLSDSGFHIERRTVLTWPAAGCPHDMTTRRNKPSPSFNLDEVRTWLALTGRGQRRASKAAPAAEASPPESSGADLFSTAKREAETRQAELRAERERDLATFAGEVDYSAVLAMARLGLHQLQEAMPANELGGQFPETWQKWADALKKLASEVRQLEESRFALAQRRAQWISLNDAKRVLGEFSSVTAAGFEAIRPDLTHAIGIELENYVDSAAIEPLRRKVAATVVTTITAQRSRMASQLEASASAIERAAATDTKGAPR